MTLDQVFEISLSNQFWFQSHFQLSKDICRKWWKSPSLPKKWKIRLSFVTVMQSRKAAFLGFCESLQSRYIHTHAAFLSLLMCLYKEENWGHCVSNVVLRLNGNGAMPKPALETIGMLSRLWPPRIGKKVDEGRKWWDLHTDVNPGSAPLPASRNRNCIFLYENSVLKLDHWRNVVFG